MSSHFNTALSPTLALWAVLLLWVVTFLSNYLSGAEVYLSRWHMKFSMVFSMVPQRTPNSIVLVVSSLPLLRTRKTSAHWLQSRSSVGDSISSVLSKGSVPVSRLMSSCPHRVVSVGEVPVHCLVDQWSMELNGLHNYRKLFFAAF